MKYFLKYICNDKKEIQKMLKELSFYFISVYSSENVLKSSEGGIFSLLEQYKKRYFILIYLNGWVGFLEFQQGTVNIDVYFSTISISVNLLSCHKNKNRILILLMYNAWKRMTLLNQRNRWRAKSMWNGQTTEIQKGSWNLFWWSQTGKVEVVSLYDSL